MITEADFDSLVASAATEIKKIIRVEDRCKDANPDTYITLQVNSKTTIPSFLKQIQKKRDTSQAKYKGKYDLIIKKQHVPENSEQQLLLSHFSSTELERKVIEAVVCSAGSANEIIYGDTHHQTKSRAKERKKHDAVKWAVPTLTGWGYKPGSSSTTFVKTNWKERWFSMNETKEFSWFEAENTGKKGSISLEKAKVDYVSEAKTKRKHCLCIDLTRSKGSGSGNYIVIQLSDQEACDRWLVFLRRAAGYVKGETEWATMQVLYSDYRSSLCSFNVVKSEGKSVFKAGVLIVDYYNGGMLRYLQEGQLKWSRSVDRVMKAETGGKKSVKNLAGRVCRLFALKLTLKNPYPQEPTQTTLYAGQRTTLLLASILSEAAEGHLDYVVRHCSEEIDKLSSFVLVAKKDADVEDFDNSLVLKNSDRRFLVLSQSHLMILQYDHSIVPMYSWLVTDISVTKEAECELVVHDFWKSYYIRFYGNNVRDVIVDGIHQAYDLMTTKMEARGVTDTQDPSYFMMENRVVMKKMATNADFTDSEDSEDSDDSEESDTESEDEQEAPPPAMPHSLPPSLPVPKYRSSTAAVAAVPPPPSFPAPPVAVKLQLDDLPPPPSSSDLPPPPPPSSSSSSSSSTASSSTGPRRVDEGLDSSDKKIAQTFSVKPKARRRVMKD